MPALLVDIPGLTSAIQDEFDHLTKKPPSREDLARVDTSEETWTDDDELIANAILPVVKVVNARSVLGGVQRQVQSVGCKACLSHLNPTKLLGYGADGEVWLLESGYAAKVGIMRQDADAAERELESVMHEVTAARAASKAGVSPAVHDAWFCSSPVRIAYVIVMDAIEGGTTLRKWKKKASSSDRRKMYDQVEALTVKLNGLGIFHDDLHDANIMVDKSGKPWIIDFSRCTFIDTLSRFKEVRGDVQKVRQSLADSYFPSEPDTLARLIACRLQNRNVISAVREASAKDAAQNASVRPRSKTSTSRRSKTPKE